VNLWTCDPPVSASWMLELHMCTIIFGNIFFSEHNIAEINVDFTLPGIFFWL
jgi:hypothetical protein